MADGQQPSFKDTEEEATNFSDWLVATFLMASRRWLQSPRKSHCLPHYAERRWRTRSWRKSTGWGISGTGCWEQHLNTSDTKRGGCIKLHIDKLLHIYFGGREAQQPPVGLGPLFHEVPWSHKNDAPQSGWLLWTIDQLVAETSTWQHTTLTTDTHPCPSGIRTRNLSRRAAADIHLRPRGQWDQPLLSTYY
jgi:hypothetical protein